MKQDGLRADARIASGEDMGALPAPTLVEKIRTDVYNKPK